MSLTSRARAHCSAGSRSEACTTLPKMVEALKADPLEWYKENKIEPPSELKEKAGAVVKEES